MKTPTLAAIMALMMLLAPGAAAHNQQVAVCDLEAAVTHAAPEESWPDPNHPPYEDHCVTSDTVDDTNEEPLSPYYPEVEVSIYAPMATYRGNDPRCPGGSYNYDTDGDGTLDVYDSDDDCDYLSDDLENQKIYSHSKQRDDDNDGVIDGFDVLPTGSVTLTLDIVKITNIDDGMDCCWGSSTKWGDPFFSYARIFYATGMGSSVLSFSGLTESNHPHDASSYTFGSDGIDTIDALEDIDDWVRSNVYDFPQFDLRLTLKDHDASYHDMYDINEAAGAAALTGLLELWDIASDPDKKVRYVFDGSADGYSSDAAKLEIDISTNASDCAIKAAMRVSQNDALVLPSEVTC